MHIKIQMRISSQFVPISQHCFQIVSIEDRATHFKKKRMHFRLDLNGTLQWIFFIKGLRKSDATSFDLIDKENVR